MGGKKESRTRDEFYLTYCICVRFLKKEQEKTEQLERSFLFSGEGKDADKRLEK